jgi:hypothetical protein
MMGEIRLPCVACRSCEDRPTLMLYTDPPPWAEDQRGGLILVHISCVDTLPEHVRDSRRYIVLCDDDPRNTKIWADAGRQMTMTEWRAWRDDRDLRNPNRASPSF